MKTEEELDHIRKQLKEMFGESANIEFTIENEIIKCWASNSNGIRTDRLEGKLLKGKDIVFD